MDLYIIISLIAVFGLLIWWLFLAVSGLSEDKENRVTISRAIHYDDCEVIENSIRLASD